MEHTRCVCHIIPYCKYQKIMITNLIQYIISNMKDFPNKNSPTTIVGGATKPDFSYKRISFES